MATQAADFSVNLPEKDLRDLIDYLRKVGKTAGIAEQDVDELMSSLEKGATKGSKHIKKVDQDMGLLGRAGRNLGPVLAAAFAADQVIQLGKEIVDLTATTQRYEAVLTNALGSRSAARVAMAQIIDFAASTNYSVDQLTDGFIKLNNGGFKPTRDEMTKLADLANYTSKSFDQLVEAIIDGQVGEFERLKEFGIRASKEGDRVRFTFKGVTQEVDFTEQSIRKYLLSLGDLQGVQGSTAAISRTMGGAISNLGDNFDNLLVTLGSIGSPLIIKGIETLSSTLGKLADTLISDEQRAFNAAAEAFEQMGGDAITLAQAQAELNKLRAQERTLVSQALADQQQVKTDQQASEASTRAQVALKLAGYQLQEDINEATQEETLTLAENMQLQTILRDVITQRQQVAAEAADAEAAAMRKVQDEALAAAGALDVYTESTKELEDFSELIDEMADLFMDVEDSAIDAADEVTKAWEDATESMRKNMERVQEYMKGEFYLDLARYAGDYANVINDIHQAGYDKDLDNLERSKDHQLALVGSNEQARARIEAKYQEEREAILLRQAKAERQAAIFNILIQSGVNAVKLFAATAPPGILSAVALGFGGLQVAAVKSQPLPAFRDGVVGFRGKGSDTSDDNPVLISNNESIINAKGTRRFRSYLELINKPGATEADLADLVLKRLPSHVIGNLMSGTRPTDMSRVEQKLDSLQRTIKDKPVSTINLDKNGVWQSLHKGSTTEHWITKNYLS